jgi:polysaccharide deacetylase 2 family uncharacterized protein YibQ
MSGDGKRRRKSGKRRARSLGWPALALLSGIGLLGLVLFLKHRPQERGSSAVSAVLPPNFATAGIAPSRPAEPPTPAAGMGASVTPPKPPVASVPAWRRNAVEVGAENQQPMIAIVLDDMGGDHARSERAIALPAPLTMSFLAYVDDLPGLTEAARRHGHELMLHIPMQPQSASADPGPQALTTTLDDSELHRRLDWDLSRLNGIVGANNHMGSRFTEWPHGMELVEQTLHDRGLFVLDSRTTPHTVVIQVADRIGIPHAQRDVFLDDDATEAAVGAELLKTEQIARQNGFAIAIGHPHDATLAVLKSWLPSAAERGFRLVPVSAIVAHNETLSGREENAAD